MEGVKPISDIFKEIEERLKMIKNYDKRKAASLSIYVLYINLKDLLEELIKVGGALERVILEKRQKELSNYLLEFEGFYEAFCSLRKITGEDVVYVALLFMIDVIANYLDANKDVLIQAITELIESME